MGNGDKGRRGNTSEPMPNAQCPMPYAQLPIINYQLPMKQRLDVLLVELGLSSSRQQAQRLIQAGEVMVDNELVDKAGTSVDVAAEIRVKQKSRFVSRGGEKLAKALDTFDIPVEGTCLFGWWNFYGRVYRLFVTSGSQVGLRY